MAERRYPRPRSPPLVHAGRTSLPTLQYPYSDLYNGPSRRDSINTPRSGTERVVVAPGAAGTTTYKIKPELLPVRDPPPRESSRNRRSTLDGAPRPTIVNPPRSTAAHGGSGRPSSPLHNPYRSSGEGGEYYSIPASSTRSRHHRGSYSATMDNADMNRQARDAGSGGMLAAGHGREGARYPRRAPVYPHSLVRRADTVADDYGENGYGYTNPRDLVQYDLNRSARYPPGRRDSSGGSRPNRPLSISGYPEGAPRSFDARERGPPPATRGLDKLASRGPVYEAPRLAPVEPDMRSPRKEQFYDEELPRRHSTSRRPVSVYHDRPRREEYYDYDPRDDERQERREREHYSRRREDEIDQRDRSERTETNGLKKRDYDRDGDYDSYDERTERKSGKDKTVSSKNDNEKRNDHDHKDEYNDHKDRKRDKVVAGISLAAAALGVGAATKSSRRDDSDDSSDDKDESRPRREGKDRRRRRESREDMEPVDLKGRDPKERIYSRDDRRERNLPTDDVDRKESPQPQEDIPVDLAGRNPQERSPRDNAPEPKEHRRHRREPSGDLSASDAQEDSPPSDVVTGHRRIRKAGGAVPFNPKDTLDLRALKEALNKQEANGPSVPAKEPLRDREGSFERKREPSIANVDPRKAEESKPKGILRQPREREGSFDREREPSTTNIDPPAREHRSRRETSDSENDKRPMPRLVSPPRKAEENKPKGILRQPREKFPEDPAHIREGVAPLKDAKKDGVPPDARWTKISRRMVNPEALDAGKERYEAREDFVIVLRVLTKEEIQGYAIATQQIRTARDQLEDLDRRRRRRERHERHVRERERGERAHRHRSTNANNNYEYDHDHRRHRKELPQRDSHSESDSTDDDDLVPPPKMIEAPKVTRRLNFDDLAPPVGAAGGEAVSVGVAGGGDRVSGSGLREDPENAGTYTGYVRGPRKEGK